jgi:hypothetical protein
MSKNNPNKRGVGVKKTFNGKIVKPVLYVGTHVGHGKYIAVQYEDGKIAMDSQNKPLVWEAV